MSHGVHVAGAPLAHKLPLRVAYDPHILDFDLFKEAVDPLCETRYQ
jgi:hypothetical protein